MVTSLTSSTAGELAGTIVVPGDKSISHRALLIGALAIGETRIDGLLEGEDVLATVAALKILGVAVEKRGDGCWCVNGRGVAGLAEPSGVLDMGNSGTAARLLMGVLAAHPFPATLSGDASLNSRPMGRVTEPLGAMGAIFSGRSGDRLPMTMTGNAELLPLDYRLPMASAQVKSAILLAGLGAPGVTRVIEPTPTRDHTERMLRAFGADVTVKSENDGGRAISLHGQCELKACDVVVPGDISSAAFPLVAALLTSGSDITIENVGVNLQRCGLLDALIEMGGDIQLSNQRDVAGEPVADIRAVHGALKGINVAAGSAAAMIDEYPVLAVAAAYANGVTTMHGLAELRHKESDRLAAIARGLDACGVRVEEGDDYLVIHGVGGRPKGGAVIETGLDHRIAMAFLVLGTGSLESVTIDDASPIETSFPGFTDLMTGLGANIK